MFSKYLKNRSSCSDKYYQCYALLLCFNVAMATGCSREPKIEFGVVDGVVTLNGSPAAELEVVFLPDPYSGTKGPRSSCYTDANGRYHLRTENGIEGAAVGKNIVLINDTAFRPRDIPPGIDPKLIPPLPKRKAVPAQYRDPKLSPIKPVEIKPGTQTHNFDLTIGTR